jgi:hypothetical protein
MARKAFIPERPAPTSVHLYAAFMAALLAGTVRATKLYVVRVPGQGTRRLEFDDPNEQLKR